jgi:uncharacterized protein (TIGR01370 family)
MRFSATLAFFSALVCGVIFLSDSHSQSGTTASPADQQYPYLLDDDDLYWDASIIAAPGVEITPAEAQLFRTYYGALGRAPDAEGFTWWSNEILAGRHDLRSMAGGFIWSQEFLGFVNAPDGNSIDNRVFLTHIYQVVFGREPDNDGFLWWLDQLDGNNRSQTDVLVDMTQSNEYAELTTWAVTEFLYPGLAITSMTLDDVNYWAYNIQHVETQTQRNELVGTHFDLYVLEPVVSEKELEEFDIAALVSDIREHNIQSRGVNPLIVAYIDVGQAESWRWYFEESWIDEDEKLTSQAPAWITGNDPDQWVGNYPVAFWEQEWEDIVMYGNQGRSLVDITLEAGFDGIYMDWIEAFADESVQNYLKNSEGVSEDEVESLSADRMLDFIEKLRSYAREGSDAANPGYLIIAQNASDLRGYDTQRYDELMDAIALEGLFFEGVDGDCESFDNWECDAGYNVPPEEITGDWTEEVMEHIAPLVEESIMPVFCAEYAQDTNAGNFGTEVYESLAPGICIPYATRRSLGQLSTKPYPAGYSPIDY